MCNVFWSPALSEELTNFEKLSGLGGTETEYTELENLQNGLGVNLQILKFWKF